MGICLIIFWLIVLKYDGWVITRAWAVLEGIRYYNSVQIHKFINQNPLLLSKQNFKIHRNLIFNFNFMANFAPLMKLWKVISCKIKFLQYKNPKLCDKLDLLVLFYKSNTTFVRCNLSIYNENRCTPNIVIHLAIGGETIAGIFPINIFCPLVLPKLITTVLKLTKIDDFGTKNGNFLHNSCTYFHFFEPITFLPPPPKNDVVLPLLAVSWTW